MFTVSRRVSFSVVIAVIVGWGIFFIFFIQSSSALISSTLASDQGLTILPNVRLSVQIDKRAYASGDAVQIAVRNDSRLPIYIQQAGDGCPTNWWSIEALQADGETWMPVVTTKDVCSMPSKMVEFPKHTSYSDQWQALIPGELGNVLIHAPSGTYRVAMPYIQGKQSNLSTWPTSGILEVTSPTFLVQ